MANRSLLFSVPHRVGALTEALNVFSRHSINLTKIDSRPSKNKVAGVREVDFFIDVDPVVSEKTLQTALNELSDAKKIFNVTLLGSSKIPWFPRRIKEIDLFQMQIMEAGGELQSDHPGFSDKIYRKRRQEISDIATSYKQGEHIPRVQYTKEEIGTWSVVYDRLVNLYPHLACAQVNYVLPLLQQNCGYSNKNIPQLEDISNFLKDTTGFRLRPVTGLLSARDFLNGLAFRVFHSTQYLRHHSHPFYTPEPDIVHELMGHVPLFADHDFADFSQEIGLASLGATDEDIKRLATLYWFTVEFGICKQDNQLKAYGAGLLSSFGELEYAITHKGGTPKYAPLDPMKTAVQEYPITTYQPLYFVAESFERVKQQVRSFCYQLPRPFAVLYNPVTESIDVINDRSKLTAVAKSIQGNSQLLQHALEKMESLDADRSGLVFTDKPE